MKTAFESPMPRTETAIALLLLSALACGKATSTSFPGNPLLSVRGQMTLVNDTAPADPIRLAIVWFPPSQTNLLSEPSAIVTSDVSYQGTFPLDYKFDLFAAPPPSALTQLTVDGQTFSYGEGVLVAYDDKNGNGQLDAIPANGNPIDHILGTSVGDFYNGLPAANPIYVDYIVGTPPSSWVGWPSGYSLINYNLPSGQQVLTSDTQVPLDLVGTNELDFLVCAEACNIAPTGGVRINGSISLADGVPSANLCLTDGTNPLANSSSASVQVNGQAISFSAADNCFEQTGGFVLNTPGMNTVDVVLDGHAPWKFTAAMTGDFKLLSPTFEDRALTGSTLDVSWSSAADVSWYQLLSYKDAAPFETDSDTVVYALNANCTMPTSATTEGIAAEAFAVNGYAEGLGGSYLGASVSESTDVDVVAPDSISLNATLSVTRSDGALSSYAFALPFSGATAITTAQVSVDSIPLVFTAADGEFELFSASNFLTFGAPNAITVQRAGQPDFTAQVQMPGDFTVTAPPATAAAGSSLTLTWTASSGASGYEAQLYGNDGLLSFVYTTDLTATIDVPSQTGPLFLYVVAYGDVSDANVIGQMQNAFSVTAE